MNKGLEKIAIALGIILYFAFTQGFIFYKFWYWFVIDVFPNLPNITYFQAVGLKLFTGIFTMSIKRSFKEEYYKEDKTTWSITLFILPWLVLFVSWLIYILIS